MAKSCSGLLTGNEEQEAFKSSWEEFSYSQVHDLKKVQYLSLLFTYRPKKFFSTKNY